MIHILRSRATPDQMRQMMETLGVYVKLAVDVEEEILAEGGELHADCEKVLLEEGSNQSDLWGANWYPLKQTLDYESLINIRSKDNNRSMEVQNPITREQIKDVVID
jgi:Protein of unknown function (DUF5674)